MGTSKLETEDKVIEKIKETYGSSHEEGVPIRSPKTAHEVLKREYRLLVDISTITITFAAFLEGRPVLFEGPPGTGKTEIGEALLTLWSGRKAFVLPCSENYDEYRVIGDFHPLKAFKYGFNEESFTPRPLLAALVLDAGVLVDEIRRSSEEFQNLLLDIIDKRRIIVPELKRVYKSRGLGFQIIFTSNPYDIAQTELSDAFLRRVIRIGFEYPSKEEEIEILKLRLGDTFSYTPLELVEELLRLVNELRGSELSYKPGVSDSVSILLIASRIARFRNKPKVTRSEIREAAVSILVKNVDEREDVLSMIDSYFG